MQVMSPLFWLETAASGFTCLVAAALLMTALAEGPRGALKLSLVLCAAAVTFWAASSLLLKLTLWLRAGDPLLWAEMSCLALLGLAPLLLGLTAGAFDRRSPLTDIGGLLGLLAVPALAVPLFQQRMLFNPRLGACGVAALDFSPLGMAAVGLPGAFLVWSLSFFRSKSRRLRQPQLGLALLLLLAGLAAGALLKLPYTALAFAGAPSAALLAWGAVRRRLFTPPGTTPLRRESDERHLPELEKARRLELLVRVGQKTTAILDADELLHQEIVLIREEFKYFNVYILLVEGDDLVLRSAALESLRKYEGRLRLRIGEEGITGWVAGCGEPLMVPDVSRDRRYYGVAEEVLTKSELAVPIMLKKKVIGVLDAQSAELNGFSTIDVFTLQAVADQLAIALENARLYEEVRKRAERLTMVNRIAAAVGAALQLDELLATVYRELTAIFRADAFFIALYDPDADELDFRLQVDEGVKEPQERQPLGSGLTSQVVREGKPLLIEDFERERERLPVPDLWGTKKMPSSWLGVPLRVGERLTGVICVQAYKPNAYGEEEKMLLLTIADQVAVAVERARLYEVAQQELRERKLAEEVLRESEEKFRNLAEQSPNMIFINREGKVVYANRLCEEVMGYSREEFYAPDFDFVRLSAPEYLELVRSSYRKHQQGQDVPPYEYALLTKEGKRIEAIFATRLIKYEGRSAILGIITDITKRKRTERLLHALNAASLSMERVLSPEQIFPTVGEELKKLGFATVVFLAAESGTALQLKYHSYDPSAMAELERLTGLRAEGYTMKAEASDLFTRVILKRGPGLMAGTEVVRQVLPKTARRFAGRIVELLRIQRSIAAPLIVEDRVIGFLAMQSDELTEEDVPTVTAFAHQMAAAWRKTRLMQDLENSLQELKRIQDELIQSQKMEAIGRLAGGIAHDFNNLLTAIGGYTELLLEGLAAGDSSRADLEEIKKAVAKAGALTRQLLAFSRKQVLQPRVLDLNEVVTGTGKMLRRLIGEHIEMIAALKPSLGRVKADPLQVEQVILNLAINAADAMPRGGKLILETANVEMGRGMDLQGLDFQPGPHVLLAVSDTGIGMDRQILSRLFEPFFTTKEQGKGTGLGLSTVYGIVKQSGGHVQVYSEPGYGSTFKIYLPRITGGATAAAPSDPPKPGLETLCGAETVLLVEGEEAARELARRVLIRCGYQLLETGQEAEALQVCRDHAGPIHLLLAAAVMPGGGSGRLLAEKMVRLRPELRVLFFSGFTACAIVHHGQEDPGALLLEKPFAPETLARKVREALEGPTPAFLSG